MEIFALLSKDKVQIPPLCAKALKTNLTIIRKPNSISRKLEICKYSISSWLMHPMHEQFTVEGGLISPDYDGAVFVKIRNNLNNPLIFEEDSPIAEFKTSKYEYSL